VNELAHFAINADDVTRGRKFYQQVFGWKFEAWGPPGFFMINTGESSGHKIFASLQQRRNIVEGARINGFECSISVADIEKTAETVKANGGRIIMPRAVIPTVGELFFFEDTEGNTVGAIRYDQHIE
jgi:uncharacterized protein